MGRASIHSTPSYIRQGKKGRREGEGGRKNP